MDRLDVDAYQALRTLDVATLDTLEHVLDTGPAGATRSIIAAHLRSTRCRCQHTLDTLDASVHALDELDALDMSTCQSSMSHHGHLCFPTKFVDNCSYIDFVIIGYELKVPTIEWRVFLKTSLTRQVYLFVRVFAFVFLYLNTIMKSQRHSTCLSPRRCGCLRVSVCPSLPVCVCLCLSLCVRLSLFVSVSVSVCQSVGLSVSVCLGLSRSGACREKVSACLCVCACHPRPTHNHSIRREGAMDDHG